MKKMMLSYVAMFIIVLAATQLTQAQTIKDFRAMPIEQKAHLLTDSLKAMLTLSDDQYSKTYIVIIEAVTKAGVIAKSDVGRGGKGRALRSLLADEEAKAKLIFTPPQFALYQTKKQNAIAYYRQHFQDEKLVFNVAE